MHFQHRAVDPATAIRVMDALTDGARADGAVDMLVAYDSPLPLLTVSRQTELVSDAHWEEWSSRHVSGLDDAKEFFRYCMDAPGLEETPAFRHAVSVFVHAS